MSLSPRETIGSAFAHHQAGNFDAAEALYRSALAEDRGNLDGLHLLGVLSHQRGAAAEAVALLEEAVAVLERQGHVAAGHAVLFNNFGNALKAAGRGNEAAAQYRRGLALDPEFADLHVNLGNTLFTENDFEGAIASYKAALQLAPEHACALVRLICILLDQGMAAEALTFCERLAATAVDDANAHFLLGRAKAALGDNSGAILALTDCLKLDGAHAGALLALGITLAKTGLGNAAVPVLERAAALRPDDASIHAELGNVLDELGDAARADACFQKVAKLRPLVTWRAARRPADFSALFIAAPGVANTPPRFLCANARFDSHFIPLVRDAQVDIKLLRQQGDVVVNLISDADQGRNALLAAATLVDGLGKRVVNHPSRILKTDRESIASLLSGIEQCNVPRTIRVMRDELSAANAVDALERRGLAFPLLLRSAGTHGGDALEKVDCADGIAAYLETYRSDALYASQYVDYRSDDGYFRKYRFFITGRDILPYHLAIGDRWKVHHYTTDMSAYPWMQEEEKAFLENPRSVFTPAHYDALAAIRDAVGLSFFGIDCSLDRDNKLLVFEVNASILIHDDNADFPYKTPFCLRIKEAFSAMLADEAAISPRPPP